jgi:hypothetical protein
VGISEDRYEIARLIFLCDQRNDAGDFDGVGELFANGTIRVKDMEGSWSGAEGVAAQFAKTTRVYPQGGARTVHLSTNLVIDVDEAAGTAVSRSVYVMLQQTDELPLQVIDAGRNTDSFTKVGGAWQWTERYINVELHGDLSHHLFMDTTPFV